MKTVGKAGKVIEMSLNITHTCLHEPWSSISNSFVFFSAIVMLKEKAPGTFVVRDSNSFPGAFGLALKVAMIPPNVQVKSSGDPQADLVRHFLIEPTPKGVRLRGCSNEPVFGSLAALVYQHSITPLALPCKLVLPEHG